MSHGRTVNRIKKSTYWDPVSGSDANDGLSQPSAVKTIDQARKLATDEHGKCFGIIIASKEHKEEWRRQAIEGGPLQCGQPYCAWCMNRLGLRKCKHCGDILPSGRNRQEHNCCEQPATPADDEDRPPVNDRHRAMELFRKARDLIRKAYELFPESKVSYMYHVPNPDKIQEGHTKCFLHGFCRKSTIHIHDKDCNIVPRNTAHFRVVPQSVQDDFALKKQQYQLAKKEFHARKSHTSPEVTQRNYDQALHEYIESHETFQYYCALSMVTKFYLLFCNESELNRRANAASKLRSLCRICHPPNAAGEHDLTAKTIPEAVRAMPAAMTAQLAHQHVHAAMPHQVHPHQPTAFHSEYGHIQIPDPSMAHAGTSLPAATFEPGPHHHPQPHQHVQFHPLMPQQPMAPHHHHHHQQHHHQPAQPQMMDMAKRPPAAALDSHKRHRP
eukprot:m.24566 g.24566  ORF g.24566 m.24566 type:complete len:442 (+) comp8606_c0_seq1:189-1514(+)